MGRVQEDSPLKLLAKLERESLCKERRELLVPACPHHIVQRGYNRSAMFVADENCQLYLEKPPGMEAERKGDGFILLNKSS